MPADDQEELVGEVTYDFTDPDEDVSSESIEDLCEQHGHKRLHVIRKGQEISIKILLVVENFRLGFYLTFLVTVILGAILTITSGPEDYDALLIEVFGVASICMYFDSPPSTYVLPSLWAISLLFIEAYILVSIFRVWVAKEENKVSNASFIGYIVGMTYVGLSVIIFSTIFAVQPEMGDAVTIRAHTIPYTNLTVALAVLAVLVTWFGEKVAWVALDRFPFFAKINYVMVFFQLTTVPVKIIHHTNCLSDLENGLWWNPADSPKLTMFMQIFDYIFLVTVVVWPTLQSAFLSYKREKTHCVYALLEDNRKAKTVADEDEIRE